MFRCPPFLRRFNTYSRVEDGYGTPPKKWTAYFGPMGAVFFLLVPQPSWFTLINSQYVSPNLRMPHAFATTILTLMALSSLAICTFRDPGRPKIDDVDSNERSYNPRSFGVEGAGEDEELLEEDEEEHNDFNSSRKWCRACWAPKPDRTHHCSSCGRCVLKMDHHCPWLSQCVGHRTHPSFLHLLFCVTSLALYIAVASSFVLYSFLFTPIAQPIDDATPLHCLFLVVMGSVFSMVIGSFFAFHIYLCFTNQTTLEQLSPYILLKYLPKPKKPRHAPGTDITRDASLPPLPSAQDDSPYYFPSPPPTPPPAGGGALPIGGVRELIFAASPLSQLPGSAPGTPPAASAREGAQDRISPTRVFSTSPVATTMGRSSVSRTTTGFHEWDEHSLSLSQRRLVRRAAGEMYLWDLGWRRNVVATLGSGEVVSSHQRYTGGEGSGAMLVRNDVGLGQNRSSRQSRSGSDDPAYGWRWWLEVLLYGGPPRGDGKTFPRNPKARAALENLRRGLEELERRERGDATTEVDGLHPSAAAAMRPRPNLPTRSGGRTESRYAVIEEEDVELDDV